MDVFLFLHCEPTGDNSPQVALYFPALNCNSATYQHRVRIVYAVLALWVLGLPLLLLWLLLNFKRNNKLTDSAVMARWGVLYRTFTYRFYWYEVLLLVRRIVVVSVAVLWMAQPALRSGCLNMLFLILTVFQIVYRPYSTPAANVWETVSLVSLALLSTLISGHSLVLDGAFPLEVQVSCSLVTVIVGTLLLGATAFNKIAQFSICAPLVSLVERAGHLLPCFRPEPVSPGEEAGQELSAAVASAEAGADIGQHPNHELYAAFAHADDDSLAYQKLSEDTA